MGRTRGNTTWQLVADSARPEMYAGPGTTGRLELPGDERYAKKKNPDDGLADVEQKSVLFAHMRMVARACQCGHNNGQLCQTQNDERPTDQLRMAALRNGRVRMFIPLKLQYYTGRDYK